MTINDEVVDAYRAGQTMHDEGGKITNNPYPDSGVDGDKRQRVLRHWWSRGYQSRLPGDDVVDFSG